MKYVLYSKEAGVYLGHCIGLGFWSNWDCAGQEYAVLFDEPTFDGHMKGLEESAENLKAKFIGVPTAAENYISEKELVSLGFKEWNRE